MSRIRVRSSTSLSHNLISFFEHIVTKDSLSSVSLNKRGTALQPKTSHASKRSAALVPIDPKDVKCSKRKQIKGKEEEKGSD